MFNCKLKALTFSIEAPPTVHMIQIGYYPCLDLLMCKVIYLYVKVAGGALCTLWWQKLANSWNMFLKLNEIGKTFILSIFLSVDA